MQQIYAAERRGLATGGAASSLGAEAAALSAYFAARLDGLRRRLPGWAIPAAVRAIHDERAAAMKALSERHAAQRHGEQEAARQAAGGRPPPQPF